MPVHPLLIEGAGLGLRSEHFQTIQENHPAVPWYEVLADNHFVEGGVFLEILHDLAGRQTPMVLHSVGLNLGSENKLNPAYLQSLQSLCDIISPPWFSDHLAWTGLDPVHHHDLLPFPFTEKFLQRVADKIKQAQDTLGIPFLVENLSYYLTFRESQIPEWEFLSRLADQAECFLLLDINNIYVNSVNLGYSPKDFIAGIDPAQVKQMHIAGFTHQEQALIDTHGAPVNEAVWELWQQSLKHLGPKPICVERDNNIPEFSEIYSEMLRAQKILASSQEGAKA